MSDDPKEPSDRELCERVARSENCDEQNRCFGELMNRYRSSVFGFVFNRRRCVLRASGIVNAVFVAFWRALREQRFVFDQPVKPYLFAIAHRKLIDDHRSERNHDATSSLDVADNPGDDEPHTIDPVDPSLYVVDELIKREEVGRVLERLSPEDKQLLVERHLDGQKVREMADSREVPPMQISRWLDRARRRFRREWEEYFGDGADDQC